MIDNGIGIQRALIFILFYFYCRGNVSMKKYEPTVVGFRNTQWFLIFFHQIRGAKASYTIIESLDIQPHLLLLLIRFLTNHTVTDLSILNIY